MSESILVADDSILVRELAENALRSRGARIDVVNDGTQAAERLRDTAPDLLIADVHMPGLDGYALCRESKSLRPATRVLLLVGTFEPFDQGAASSARADGVLRKPFLADELLRKVEDLMGPVRRAAPPAPPAPERVEEPSPAAEPLTEEPVSGGPETTSAVDTGVAAGAAALSDADVDRIARRVLELGGAEVLERVAREMLREAAAARAAGGSANWRGDPERQ